MGRSYGPMSESVIMDKACREVTRDYGKIISFIQKETNDEKKEALFTLWHSIKYFCDVYDGADSIVRAEPAYAKHVVHVYEKILRQQNGRKLLIVAMAGITSPDSQYYAVWGTCRGISTAQMQVLEIYLDKMRAQANPPSPSIGDATIDDDDEGDDDGNNNATVNDTIGEVDAAKDTTIVIDSEDAGDVDAGTERDAAVAPIADTDGGPTDKVVVDVDAVRTNLDEFRNLTIDDLVDRVVLRTQQMLAAQDESSNPKPAQGISTDTDVVMESADESPRHVKIGEKDAIERTMDDSGVVSVASQILPKPNVTIDCLDNPADAFSEDSWFDEHAQALLHSTPATTDAPTAPTAPPAEPEAPVRGKITIDINRNDFTLYCDQWSNRFHFSHFGYLQRFICDIVKGPTATVWYSKRRPIERRNYRNESKDNFPNFHFENHNRDLYPRPRQTAPINFIENNDRNHSQNTLVMTAQQRRANYRRQNATTRNSPNVRNLRLHNRSGSRGSVNASIDTTQDSVAIENLSSDQFPAELAQEVKELRERIDRIDRINRLDRDKKQKKH